MVAHVLPVPTKPVGQVCAEKDNMKEDEYAQVEPFPKLQQVPLKHDCPPGHCSPLKQVKPVDTEPVGQVPALFVRQQTLLKHDCPAGQRLFTHDCPAEMKPVGQVPPILENEAN